MVETKLNLPAAVLGFVQAMNMHDLDGMVSRFAKPQIGQTSSDSKLGLFTADPEGELSTDYTAPKFFEVKLRRLFSVSKTEG